MGLFARYTSQLPAVLLLFMCTLLKNADFSSFFQLPGQPPALIANSVSMHVIDISWREPNDTGAGITGYEVQWQVVGKLTKNQKVVRGSRTAKLDVMPYTKYNIKVRASNRNGYGRWSWILQVRSEESVPSAAPGNFKLTSSSSLSLDVSWDAIPEEQQQGKLLGYYVYFKIKGSAAEQNKTVGPAQLTLPLTQLEFAVYVVRVAGYTAVGVGKSTAELNKIPNEGAPTPPRNFKLVVESSTSIRASWLEPLKFNGRFRRYVAMYGKVRGKLDRRIYTQGTAYLLIPLEELTEYFVQVYAETSVSGANSNIEQAKTFEGGPSHPQNVEVRATSSVSIHVRWDEPAFPNGIIKEYIISYGTSKDFQPNEQTVTGNTMESVLDGLNEFTTYFIKVRGKTTEMGNASKILNTTTYEDISPQIVVLPRNQTVPEGNTTKFLCRATGFPKPATTWKFNDGNLSSLAIEKNTEEGYQLLLPNVTKDMEGTYKCTAENKANTTSSTSTLHILEKPTSEIIPKEYPTLLAGDPLRLTCKVNTVTSHIKWKKNGASDVPGAQIGPRVGDESTLYIENVVPDDSGVYSCEAHNMAAIVSSTVKITVRANPSPSGGSVEWYYIVGPVSAFIVCAVAVGCCICRRRRRAMASNEEEAVELKVRNENVDKWEIARDRIILKETIGHGAFGAVWRARLSQPDGKLGNRTVAVKCFTPTSGEEGKKALMREIELGKLFGEKEQPNIIKFIGCVTTEGHPIMVMEYLALGDLLGLLRRSRGVHDKYHLGEGSIEELGIYDLLSFSKQIATGMVFLGSRGIIHRDLAARNVLVDKHYICKVTDFGLAYQTFKYGHGNAKKGCIPVKWTAPEILFGNVGELSPLSDVWSYGIVLYEIFTIGGIPYPDWSEARTVVEIKQGYKMPKPPHVDKSLYDIMVRCWNVNPDFRPPFENLRKRMESYIRDTTYLDLINMDEYDSSRYAKVEDMGGEDIKEQSQDAKSSGKKSGARRCASVR